MKNGIDAMNPWIETAKEFKDHVPEPDSSQARGRFVQRIPKSLHVTIAERAKQEGVNMNALVTSIIAESLGKKEAHQKNIKACDIPLNFFLPSIILSKFRNKQGRT